MMTSRCEAYVYGECIVSHSAGAPAGGGIVVALQCNVCVYVVDALSPSVDVSPGGGSIVASKSNV